MTSRLRVLIVEDSEDDALLNLRELRRGGYSVDYVRVDTSTAMKTALDEQTWDIVIADYTLPAFSAPEALKLLQSMKLDLPFIIVSGTIGEDIAVAAMKAGAHDYIIKGNLARLVPAVERELREAQERYKRHCAEQALRDSEVRYRLLFESNPHPMWVFDSVTLAIVAVNQAAINHYGYSEAEFLQMAIADIYPPENLPSRQQILSPTNICKHQKKDGSLIDVEVVTHTLTFAGKQAKLVLVDDITEKKQLEAQFLRAQRLESLGTLASGIAHDFNNILTPVLAVAQLLPLKFPNLDENSQQLFKILEDSAKRGADLVKQILSFTSGGTSGGRTVVQVRHLLADIAQVARRTFPKSIETQTDITPDLWKISADATQIHQVLMNLAVNARDAMPNGGILSIKAENLWIDENYARMYVDAQVGPYTVISITDTGVGIPPEIIDRIFDPFFTTKEVGKGTGLGLSTVMGIVKSHRGFVNVQSEVGKGSCFQVYLPSSQVGDTQTTDDVEIPNGNGELILVVDDEATICEIAKSTLETHNYKVLTASDGIEALALYAQEKDNICAVLIDMMMPGMDGSTTILTLQRMNPQVQIIAMSGLMTNWTNAEKMNLGIQEFLPKPFTAPALLSTLQEVLYK